MAKLSGPWDKARIMGMKGKLDFYYWKGIPVVRKWPYTPPSHITTATRAQNPKFALVSSSYRLQSATVIDALHGMSDGTQWTTRDEYTLLNYKPQYTIEYSVF